MKRFSLVVLFTIVMATVLAGCGLLSQQTTETQTKTPPAQEVTMVHPSGIPVLMYHKIGDDKDNDGSII